MSWDHHRDIVALVNAAHLPAIYPEREYADDGGLMASAWRAPDGNNFSLLTFPSCH